MALGEKFGAELPALAHDGVRAPALEEITEGGQLGADVEPGEELPDHHPVCAVHVHLGEPTHQRHPLIAGGLVDRREREAETLDIAPELTLGRDENVVPSPNTRARERSQRPDVSGAPAGCEEDAHAVGGRADDSARTRDPRLGRRGCARSSERSIAAIEPRCSVLLLAHCASSDSSCYPRRRRGACVCRAPTAGRSVVLLSFVRSGGLVPPWRS